MRRTMHGDLALMSELAGNCRFFSKTPSQDPGRTAMRKSSSSGCLDHQKTNKCFSSIIGDGQSGSSMQFCKLLYHKCVAEMLSPRNLS